MNMNSNDDGALEKRMAKEAHLFEQVDQALLQQIRKENPNHLNQLRNELDAIDQTSFTLNGTGMLACCLTFATLRFGPRVYRRVVQRSSGYVFDPPPRPLSLRILSTVLAVGKLGVEMWASLLVGQWVTEHGLDEEAECHAGSYLYNKTPQGGRTFLSKLSYFPPLTGRSNVATDFCPIVQDKLRNVREAESYELGQLLSFVENCSKRQAFERRMKYENRLQVRNDTSSSDHGGEELADNDGRVSVEEHFEDWAEELVTDQAELDSHDDSPTRHS
jgi:hypothetical protein